VNARIFLTIVLSVSGTAMAETIGTTGGGSFMFGGSAPAAAPVAPAPRAPIDVRTPIQRNTENALPPLPPPRPRDLTAPAAAITPATSIPAVAGDMPFKASINIGSTRCPDPVAHPNARQTPVKVYVDQQTQSIRIETPDRPRPVESRVSTGGGLKIPNGELKKAPYCARTPQFPAAPAARAGQPLIISAVTPEMFNGTGCTSDEIRAKSTVFPMYHTRTFTDKNGNPVPMPNAVRIAGGIFFHEVPPSYREMLGHNVSGDCVRLAPSVAKFLRTQIAKYGAIQVEVSAPPTVDPRMPQYCDDRMVADASQRLRPNAPNVASRPQTTGTEDVYGGQESFFSVLGRFFTPQQMPSSGAPRPARPVAGYQSNQPTRN